MKNSFKNIVIMFVMLLSIMGFYSINAFADYDWEVGVSNLNGTVENSAQFGDILVHPEKGWKRIDDNEDGIYYSENFESIDLDANRGEVSKLYGGSRHLGIITTDSKITFKFYGSKIRLFEVLCFNRSQKGTITIDNNQPEICSAYGSKTSDYDNQSMFYEKKGLDKKIHTVEISIPGEEGACFALDCLDIDEDGYILADKNILNIELEKEKINLNQTVKANVTIDNITEIAAEDMIIKYDSEKLKFLGAEAVEGIKVVKDEETDGQLRVILASQGKDNIANAKKVLLKLNFQGIAVGDALVDITKAKISDGIEMERDLVEDECGQATITIEDYKDPSKDGQFTLLDLAIDGRYYGLNPSDCPQYKTDVVENGVIDDEDLLQIGKYMMENPDYSFNN